MHIGKRAADIARRTYTNIIGVDRIVYCSVYNTYMVRVVNFFLSSVRRRRILEIQVEYYDFFSPLFSPRLGVPERSGVRSTKKLLACSPAAAAAAAAAAVTVVVVVLCTAATSQTAFRPRPPGLPGFAGAHARRRRHKKKSNNNNHNNHLDRSVVRIHLNGPCYIDRTRNILSFGHRSEVGTQRGARSS